MMAPWPFIQWGLDILGSFPIGTRQMKFWVVRIDYFKVGRSRTRGKHHTTECKELRLEKYYVQVWGVLSTSVRQWTKIWQCTFQRFLWTLWNSKSLFFTGPPSSKRLRWSCKPIIIENHQDSSWGDKGSMAGWAAGCVMGIQDDCENPYRGNPFQASLWKRGNYTCRSAHGQPQGDDVSR